MVCDSRIGSIFEYIKSKFYSRISLLVSVGTLFHIQKARYKISSFYIKFSAYFLAWFATKLRFPFSIHIPDHLVYWKGYYVFAYTVKKG